MEKLPILFDVTAILPVIWQSIHNKEVKSAMMFRLKAWTNFVDYLIPP